MKRRTVYKVKGGRIVAPAVPEPVPEPPAPLPPRKPKRLPQGSVESLMERLLRAVEQQAAATTPANRDTRKKKAGLFRAALRLKGVESPPDRNTLDATRHDA